MNSIPQKKKLKQTHITELFFPKGSKEPMDPKETRKDHSGLDKQVEIDDEMCTIYVTENTHIPYSGSGTSTIKNVEKDFRKKLQIPSMAELAESAQRQLPGKRKSSQDMFDSPPVTPSCSLEETLSWRGTPLSSLTSLSNSIAEELSNVPTLAKTYQHCILVALPLQEMQSPQPYPSAEERNQRLQMGIPVTGDSWDHKHVRLPNCSQSLYPTKNGEQDDNLVERWVVIRSAYDTKISNVSELRTAILSYNQKYKNKWTFLGLEKLIEQEFCDEEALFFFDKLLPGIIQLALDLPNIVTSSIPLLSQDTSRSLTMSQKQVACLLANAFLCTFPRRNARGKYTEYGSYPDINFNRLFHHRSPVAIEKMKCILHYFKEVTTKEPDGLITFTRNCIRIDQDSPYEISSKKLPLFHIDSKGLIEEATGLLQVDFANKCIGGGVLGLGCVQEEIRFVLCPELIITRLFTEILLSTEALIVTGVQRFSEGTGYSSTFKWAGPHYDVACFDRSRRRLCQVVCLDALHYTNDFGRQYSPRYIHREIHKAYVGFENRFDTPTNNIAVATGNWGCGAFGGNPLLKGLIQFAACGLANRDIAYFTFGDTRIRDELGNMFQFLTEHSVTVGELVMVLCQYGSLQDAKCKSSKSARYGSIEDITGKDLYDYIRQNISACEADTVSEMDSFGGSSNHEVKADPKQILKAEVAAAECSNLDKSKPMLQAQIEETLTKCEQLLFDMDCRSPETVMTKDETDLSNTQVFRQAQPVARTEQGSTASVFDCLDRIEKGL